MGKSTIREPASFKKKPLPHKIIIKNGNDREFNINRLLFSIASIIFLIIFIIFISIAAYLIFRDDLVNFIDKQQAYEKNEYEERIAALRSRLDQVISHQLLDQQTIENQLHDLIERQKKISNNNDVMKELLEEAHRYGIHDASRNIPVPVSKPARKSTAAGSYAVFAENIDPVHFPVTDPTFTGTTSASTNEKLKNITQSISIIESYQRKKLDTIRIAAAKRTENIRSTLHALGIANKKISTANIGGPFVSSVHDSDFDALLHVLRDTLKTHDTVIAFARNIPIGNPLPNARISSPYGNRIDPFNARSAMHNGVDFSAPSGTPIIATGDGVIVNAMRKGGYGKLVEIQHQGGYTTRYAHLSKISVKSGQRIKKGQVIGKVGSSGRSTGPHLHYEIRQSKKPLNPAKYLETGKKIANLIQFR